MRELDADGVRAGTVVVETREARGRGGRSRDRDRRGAIGPATWSPTWPRSVRGTPVRGREDITLFKSVGVAFEDLVVARAAVDRLA